MECWGFKYKTQAIWDKTWIGMGYWFRGQHEILLVGVKGKFSPPESKSRVSSVYKEKKGKHSKKPEYFRDMIDNSFSKDLKRVELFCRYPKAGWDVWGNEVKSNIELAIRFS
jgi:N6-adenosine-specific RNA methylase IME4